MNETDKHSLNLAREAIDTIEQIVQGYNLTSTENTQIETVLDTTNTSSYFTIKLDVTIYRDFEVSE